MEAIINSPHGCISETMARYYFKQFIEGLDHIHKSGICHRDLKPENLLLNEDFTVKIADFGLSAPLEGRNPKKNKNGLRRLNSWCGTEYTMAPEV